MDEEVIGTSIAGVTGVIKIDVPPSPPKTAPAGAPDVMFVGGAAGAKIGDVVLAMTTGAVTFDATTGVVTFPVTAGVVTFPGTAGVVTLVTIVVPITITPAGGGAGTVEFAH